MPGADFILAPCVGEVYNDTYPPEVLVRPHWGQRRREAIAKGVHGRTGVPPEAAVLEEVEAVVFVEHNKCEFPEAFVDPHQLADHAGTGEELVVLQVDGLATRRCSHEDKGEDHFQDLVREYNSAASRRLDHHDGVWRRHLIVN